MLGLYESNPCDGCIHVLCKSCAKQAKGGYRYIEPYLEGGHCDLCGGYSSNPKATPAHDDMMESMAYGKPRG